jgi:hypothetical protein
MTPAPGSVLELGRQWWVDAVAKSPTTSIIVDVFDLA